MAAACRSVRRFDENRRIPSSELENLVDVVRLVPSASNRQPLKYITISDKSECDKVFPHLLWAGLLKDWPGPAEGERPAGYIVMLVDKEISFNAAVDTGIAGYALMLAAMEKGLGSCMLASVSRPKLYKILGIDPERFDIAMVFAFGYPKEHVVLEEAVDGNVAYYRTEDGTHHVPKRPLDEVLIR